MTITFSLKEVAWKRIFIFLAIIFIPNLLIMKTDIVGPANDVLGLATAFDLVVVLPLSIYFFGFRKRVSILLLFAFMFWGLLLANWLIPKEADEYLFYFNYSVIAIEAFIITLELFLFVTIIRKLPNFIQNYKDKQKIHYHFLLSFSSALQQTFTS